MLAYWGWSRRLRGGLSTAQTDSFSCRFAGCAAPPTPAGPCVGHCDSEQLREAVAHWVEHDQPIELHNANVTADAVALLADGLPREKGGTTVLPAINCSGAAFAGARIDFSRFRFTG